MQRIHTLFAEPVSINENLNIDNKLLLDDLQGVKLAELKKKGNFLSESLYILNKINYGEHLKQIFSERIKKNFKDLGYNTSFTINTSWLTSVKPHTEGEFHYHANHWWSGCYYPSQFKKRMFITFKRLNNFMINPKVENYNCFNCNEVSLEIQEGTLLLFPSYIEHKIGYNDSDKNRISLAFNIKPLGPAGNADSEYWYE